MIALLTPPKLKLFAFFALIFPAMLCFSTAKAGKGKMSMSKAVPLPADSITLIDGTISITLDTIKAGVINQYTVKLTFKLKNYAHSHNDNLKVHLNLRPIIALNNLSLYKDSTDIVLIEKADWGNSTDATVTKQIAVSVQQTDLVTAQQEVVISPVSKDIKGNFVLRFMPYTGKVKPGALKLVLPGKAEISSAKKLGITHEYGSELNNIDTITVHVKLHGYDPAHNQLVFMLVDSLDTAMSKHFKIFENPVTIVQSDWQSAKIVTSQGNDTTRMLIIHLHIKTTGMNDSLNNVEYVDLMLKGQPQVNKGAQRVNVSIKDKPFWAEVGTNFDLLDKIKTNNFYAGVYMFDKDIGRIGWFNRSDAAQRNKNLSFTGGVYESQSVSTSSTTASGIAYRTMDSVYRSTGVTSAATSVKTIGILFSPHLKLTNGKTDENGLHVFASLYGELLWQTISSNFSYSKDSLSQPTVQGKISQYPYKETSVNYDFRAHYIGVGLPIYIKETAFNLYINSVIGGTNQKYIISNNNIAPTAYTNDPLSSSNGYISDLTFRPPASNWNFFYLFQYRLNEVAYGITFSGEIRGLLVQDSKPVITLALSKKFDLSALLKPLVAPF